MPRKRKRSVKLPNGFGSIRYLGENRRNKFAVHPPATEFSEDGKPIRPQALCYVDDHTKGILVLCAFHNGTYTPGYEKTLPITHDVDDKVIQALLADFSRVIRGQEKDSSGITFREMFNEFLEREKLGKNGKLPSKSKLRNHIYTFKKFSTIYDKPFKLVKYEDLQRILDETKTGYSFKKAMVSTVKGMYKYAKIKYQNEYDASYGLEIHDKDETESGVPFSLSDIAKLYSNIDDFLIETLFIMCLSGHRIGELRIIEVDLENMCFNGGNKTDAGQSKCVPIHSAIQGIVRKRIEKYGCLMPVTINTFRKELSVKLTELNLYTCTSASGNETHHTPHDCRHTFAMLCDHYKVDERAKKRMIGHAFNDTTNRVYGHALLEDLKAEIEKIDINDIVTNL